MTASIQRPPALQPGDLVRVVAPSSPFSAAALEAGIATLEGWGLRTHAREDIHDRRAYFAGTPRRRADELHEAFSDPECKAIIPVRGGYGLTTVLPLLNADLIRANPTAIVGCSDFTVLLNYLVQHCETTAFHGPMLGSLGSGLDAAGSARLKDLLFGGKPGTVRSAADEAEAWCVSPGAGKGIAIGGSLSLIAAQCGTPWQLNTEGRVLFLEDVGERPYCVDRLLVQLEQAGLFDRAAGVVLGDFTGCEDGDGALTWRHAVDRVFRRKAVPVLAGLPFGHGNPNLAFPVGVRCEVDASRGSVRFRKSALA